MKLFAFLIFTLALAASCSSKKSKANYALDSLAWYTTTDQLKKAFGDSALSSSQPSSLILFSGSRQEVTFGLRTGSNALTYVAVSQSSAKNKRTSSLLPATWTTRAGLAPGMALEEIQIMNGKPFTLTRDLHGLRATDWNGGTLAAESAEVTFAVASSFGPAIATPASSEDFLNRQWKLRIASIMIRKPGEMPENQETQVQAPMLAAQGGGEDQAVDTLAARREFQQAFRELPRESLPYDFVAVRNTAGKEVKCYGFPDGGYCTSFYRDRDRDVSKLFAVLADTSNFYAILWSGSTFAYFADIYEVYLSTYDKNWNHIATANLHIWLAGWKYAQGDCSESVEPRYTAVIQRDFSFSLTYGCEISCAGEDSTPYTDTAQIWGQISSDGTITVNRQGFPEP